MAGGPHAQHVVCMQCAAKATRTFEGQETDQYSCENGHDFAMDWSRGVPEEPQWPPAADVLALLKSMGILAKG